jgi:hypothetical protein
MRETRYLKLDWHEFNRRTCGWDLDKVGFLMRLLETTWHEQRPVDPTTLKGVRWFGMDPRTIKRLYTGDVREAVTALVRQRIPLSDFHVKDVWARSGGVCFHCQETLADDWEIDHLVPVARSGMSHRDNLVASCRSCNRSKGAHLVEAAE